MFDGEVLAANINKAAFIGNHKRWEKKNLDS